MSKTVWDQMNGQKRAKITGITPIGNDTYAFEFTSEDGLIYQSDHRMIKMTYKLGDEVDIAVVNDYVAQFGKFLPAPSQSKDE